MKMAEQIVSNIEEMSYIETAIKITEITVLFDYLLITFHLPTQLILYNPPNNGIIPCVGVITTPIAI